MTFKELDLRTQLTDELKSKWYYQRIKWGLKIDKQSVVFDESFKFELKCIKEIDIDENDNVFETDNEIIEICYNGVIKYELGDADAMYSYSDKLYNNPNSILDDILVYIANYI